MRVPASISGNLTSNPVLRPTRSGSVANLRVASTDRQPDGQGGFRDGATLYMDVVAWGSLGQNAAKSLKKGDAVTATGHLESETWTPEQGAHAGEELTRIVLVADTLGPDLRWATCVVTKVRPGVEQSAVADTVQ
jgi:single-strand DNA-binding protein